MSNRKDGTLFAKRRERRGEIGGGRGGERGGGELVKREERKGRETILDFKKGDIRTSTGHRAAEHTTITTITHHIFLLSSLKTQLTPPSPRPEGGHPPKYGFLQNGGAAPEFFAKMGGHFQFIYPPHPHKILVFPPSPAHGSLRHRIRFSFDQTIGKIPQG